MPSKGITNTTRDNQTYEGYLTEPEGDGKVPGILLIPAIFGTDDEMKELADAWAADGFVVSVPDIFWRVMPGPTADIEKAFGRYNAFDADGSGTMEYNEFLLGLKGPLFSALERIRMVLEENRIYRDMRSFKGKNLDPSE